MLNNRSTLRVAPLILVLSAALTGCAVGENASSHEFTLTVEDGVELALTTGGPKYEGEIFTYEKVLEIRPDPDVEESFLYSPQWMTMADDGRVFVGDMGDEQVVVFSAAGDYLYRIGREGQGPGEFQSLTFVDVEGDVLWVDDRFRRHSFQLDGTFIATDTLPLEARSVMRDGRWWRLSDGRIVMFNLQWRSQQYNDYRAEMHVLEEDGDVSASVMTPWVIIGERLANTDCERPVSLTYFFATSPWAAFDPEYGFVLVDPTVPEVPIYDTQGELRRVLRVDMSERRVTEDERAWALEQLDDAVRRADEGARFPTPCVARHARDNPRFADPKHYWSRPVVDDKGYLWLWIVDSRDSAADTPRYAVFSPEGEYLGVTQAPAWSQIYNGHLLVRLDDPDTGEVLPTVYRIRPAVDGLTYE